VICATVALRVDLERQSQKVPSLYVDIMTHKGLVKAWTLDSRGEANFADQHWAKEHFPEVYPQKCMPLMATSYGRRPLAIRTGDSNDLKRENVHDFHATMLHCLGIDHTRFTYRFEGRDYRLTDVSGEVVKALLA